ncbi:hypothetical protein SAMD00019534_092320 [Acytostelium subglobosum LB1]|uniref:hypothetical protein n=1 Tax=Acytostelium subglobosum LB1 TaxID=1410327 RepID=UPI000644E63E|nr:hypothetical protein SAMD00019534_092320 [Acytostelium subglobosum LB1]GAM26057.1 hypothetical protein SAMD00019534_092320 [Acytostelium subglobosum LB1]|eukprot:XP_012751100.1 hypothetical protein SAMD00019534_092320 [Acytostelium subglobosum LB1]
MYNSNNRRVVVTLLLLTVVSLLSISSTLVTAESSQQQQGDLTSFITWLTDNGVFMSDSLNIVHIDGYGRSIVANKDIEKSTKLIEVPTGIMMAKDGVDKHIPKEIVELMKQSEIARTDAQAIYLMYSRLNTDAFWYPYASVLPETFTTTLYFNDEEMAALQRSKLRDFAMGRSKGIQHHYDTIFDHLKTVNDEFKKPEYTFELFRWALSCIWSRAFSLSKNDGGLVPLADMFNAEDKENAQVVPDSRPNKLTYYSNKPIKKGEQVFTPYGVYKTFSSAQLLMDYGFVFPQGSSGDTVYLDMEDLRKDEPLRMKKGELLRGANVTREIMLVRGKMPKELMVYARVKNINEQELDEAKTHFTTKETRDKPLNKRNEKVALRYMITFLSKFLDTYDTTLEQDIELIKQYEEDVKLVGASSISLNMANAIRVRKSEKEVLSTLIKTIRTLREGIQ